MIVEKLNKKEVYLDPLHGYIQVEYKLIYDLIQSKEMQRLKHIKQLGGTTQVFPTAEHSRFAHALGTYEIARCIIEKSDSIKETLSEEEKVVTLCAALLHDLGHGPFSHAFEMVNLVPHEDYTVQFILEDSEVHQILNNVDKNLPRQVADVITKKHPNHIMCQIVSSQLDADRMDYLSRDAYFTGINYGYIDHEKLIRSMVVDGQRICFKESGLSSIENFILGRYHMYKQVYYHPSSLAYEMIVVGLLRRYIDLYKEGFAFKDHYKILEPLARKTKLNNDEYLCLDDHLIYACAKQFENEDDVVLKDLSQRLIYHRPLKSIFVNSEEEKEAILLKLKEANYDPRYYYFTNKASQVVYKSAKNDDLSYIGIYTKKGIVEELSKVSFVVKALVEGNINTNSSNIVISPIL